MIQKKCCDFLKTKHAIIFVFSLLFDDWRWFFEEEFLFSWSNGIFFLYESILTMNIDFNPFWMNNLFAKTISNIKGAGRRVGSLFACGVVTWSTGQDGSGHVRHAPHVVKPTLTHTSHEHKHKYTLHPTALYW